MWPIPSRHAICYIPFVVLRMCCVISLWNHGLRNEAKEKNKKSTYWLESPGAWTREHQDRRPITSFHSYSTVRGKISMWKVVTAVHPISPYQNRAVDSSHTHHRSLLNSLLRRKPAAREIHWNPQCTTYICCSRLIRHAIRRHRRTLQYAI